MRSIDPMSDNLKELVLLCGIHQTLIDMSMMDLHMPRLSYLLLLLLYSSKRSILKLLNVDFKKI